MGRDFIVVGPEDIHDASGIVDAPRRLITGTLVLERAVPAFQLAVALPIVGNLTRHG